MRRRDWMELAVGSLGSLALGGAIPAAPAQADCALPEERASLLPTNVHAGGDAYVWLGQPASVPTPTDLELRSGGASVRVPIAWVVPGLARVRVPGTASGSVQLVAPPRSARGASASLDLTLAAGPPPARISGPPRDLRVERTMRPVRFSSGETVILRFAAAPPTAREVIARWAGFGAHYAIGDGVVEAFLYYEGRCSSFPIDASAPRPGTPIDVAFLDDEGNLSSFVTVRAPA
jgi:hypothetical protein